MATSKSLWYHVLDYGLTFFQEIIHESVGFFLVSCILEFFNCFSYLISNWVLALFITLSEEVDFFRLLPAGIRLNPLKFIEL